MTNFVLKQLDAPLEAVFSTAATAARGIETVVFADEMLKNYNELIDTIKAGDTRTFNGTNRKPLPGPLTLKALVSWKPHAAHSVIGS